MMALIDYRLRVTLNDGRQMTGQLLAFDTHMNLVLSNAEEFRRIKPKKKKTQKANKKQKVSHGDTAAGQAHIDEEEEDDDEPHPPVQEQKRTLGLIILRGETIISISVDAPPPESKRDMPVMAPGPGRGVPTGRGAAMGAVPMIRPPFGPPPGFGGPPPMGPPPGFGGPPPGFARPPPGFRPPGA